LQAAKTMLAITVNAINHTSGFEDLLFISFSSNV